MDVKIERETITIFDPEERQYCEGLLDEIEKLQDELEKSDNYKIFIKLKAKNKHLEKQIEQFEREITTFPKHTDTID